jgi:hypothetical protein
MRSSLHRRFQRTSAQWRDEDDRYVCARDLVTQILRVGGTAQASPASIKFNRTACSKQLRCSGSPGCILPVAERIFVPLNSSGWKRPTSDSFSDDVEHEHSRELYGALLKQLESLSAADRQQAASDYRPRVDPWINPMTGRSDGHVTKDGIAYRAIASDPRYESRVCVQAPYARNGEQLAADESNARQQQEISASLRDEPHRRLVIAAHRQNVRGTLWEVSSDEPACPNAPPDRTGPRNWCLGESTQR